MIQVLILNQFPAREMTCYFINQINPQRWNRTVNLILEEFKEVQCLVYIIDTFILPWLEKCLIYQIKHQSFPPIESWSSEQQSNSQSNLSLFSFQKMDPNSRVQFQGWLFLQKIFQKGFFFYHYILNTSRVWIKHFLPNKVNSLLTNPLENII